jgi:hypothetical protein
MAQDQLPCCNRSPKRVTLGTQYYRFTSIRRALGCVMMATGVCPGAIAVVRTVVVPPVREPALSPALAAFNHHVTPPLSHAILISVEPRAIASRDTPVRWSWPQPDVGPRRLPEDPSL